MQSRSTEAAWERLETLLEPIHSSALATARRLCRSRGDGDDLYQESVLRALEKLHTLRDESRFRPWFYATLSRHRSRSRRIFWKRQVPLDEAFAREREPVGEDGSGWAEQIQRANRATEALRALDAKQREVIVLFEIDGYTIEEIADMQRASISAVKSRLARGRQKLRRFYERRGFRAPGPDAARRREDPIGSGLLGVVAAAALETVKERSHE